MSAQLTVADVLERAANRLSKRGAWTQHEYARDRDGNEVEDPTAPEAVCWCAVGAIWAETGSFENALTSAAFVQLDAITGVETIMWNDKYARRKRDVIEAFRQAAAKASTPTGGGHE